MRFFFLKDYQQWLLSVFLGLVLAVLVYLAFKSYLYARERSGRKAGEEFEYPDGLRGKNCAPPPLMLLLYFGIIVWAVCYVIFIGIFSGPF